MKIFQIKFKFIVLGFLLILLSMACGKKPSKDVSYETSDNLTVATEEGVEGIAMDKSTVSLDQSKTSAAQSSEQNRTAETPTEVVSQKIIKSAEISFKIEKYDKAREKILQIVKNHQGSVSSENQTGNEYLTTNSMQIRVANEKFDALIADLLTEAVFVDFKKINASDVTEEFVDISARLKSKKEAMLQYEIILKKAYSIDEILDVQTYIRNLQEEIESIEGRLKYLNNRVDQSTITLTFYEEGTIMPAQKESFGYKLREALSWGWQGLVTFFLVLIYLWPLWIIVFVTYFVIRYFVRKARKKRALRKQQ